jgi:hypothetical protein
MDQLSLALAIDINASAQSFSRLMRDPAEIESEGWQSWLRRYFPRDFSRPFTVSQTKFWEWGDALEPGVQRRPYVICDPRGLGKSTNAESLIVYLLARRRIRYVLYLSGTENQAEKHLAGIKRRLETEAVLRDYPQLRPRAEKTRNALTNWSRQRLVTADGAVVEAIWLLGSSRGFKSEENERPDLLVMDDIDTLKDSRELTQKKLEILRNDILPAGAEIANVIFPQNLIHRDSICAQVLDQRADILTDRIFDGPNPLLKWYDAEKEYLEDGSYRWRIVAGETVDPAVDLKHCERLLARFGKFGFERECQHNVALIDEGNDFLGYDEIYHVCTVSEVAAGFKRAGADLQIVNGRIRWPERWEVADGLDWGCLTLDTEILTREGWKTHDQLIEGEEVAAYDWENKREIVWSPLLKKVYKNDQPLVEMRRKSFRFVCTPDHAWIVKRKKRERMTRDTYKRQNLNEISFNHAQTVLVLAANCYEEPVIQCSPAMAAVLGWLVTDGWEQDKAGILCQKNYPDAVIADLEASGLRWKELKPSANGTRLFYLGVESMARLCEATGYKGKESLPALVTRLSGAAREAMLNAMLAAEGTNNGTLRKAVFCQKRGPVMDAFQILATLSGIRLGLEREHQSQWGKSNRVPLLRHRTLQKPEITSLPGLHNVWCPSVKEGAVIARHNGQITITGNTTRAHPSAYTAWTRPDQRYPFDDVVLGIGEVVLPHFPYNATEIAEVVSPGGVARAIRAWRAMNNILDGQIKLSVMSHEASAALNAFILDLPKGEQVFFRKWKAQRGSGVPAMQNLMDVNPKRPHPFRIYPPGHPKAGEPVMGYTRFILVVPDGQGELYCDAYGQLRVRGAKDSSGFARLRFEIPLYSQFHTGQNKIDDDAVDSSRGVLAQFALHAAPLNRNEQIEAAIPEPLRYESLRETAPQGQGLTPEAELAYVLAKQEARKKVKSSVQRFDEFGRLIS